MNRRNLCSFVSSARPRVARRKPTGPTRLRPASYQPTCANVERDGEGLVRTTFGDYPDRTPDWMRAGSVLSLLKQVWTRGKGANPGLPAKQVKMLDDAIAAADTAITAPIKKARSSRLTWWGSPCPNCSTISNPDAPLEIVRMDAVFRQLGIDAHFGKAADATPDLTSLKTDWNNSKAAVGMRAPQCHRVGGTATVAVDIDQSLATPPLDPSRRRGDRRKGKRERRTRNRHAGATLRLPSRQCSTHDGPRRPLHRQRRLSGRSNL